MSRLEDYSLAASASFDSPTFAWQSELGMKAKGLRETIKRSFLPWRLTRALPETPFAQTICGTGRRHSSRIAPARRGAHCGEFLQTTSPVSLRTPSDSGGGPQPFQVETAI